MEKPTLENIAPYLPYGLKVKYNQSIFYITSTTANTAAVLKLERYYSNGRSRKYFNEVWLIEDERFKPILRPMDLTKPITIEGKEVIPIVELAEIAFPNRNWKKANTSAYTDYNHFGYDIDNKCFYLQGRSTLREKDNVHNQLALFQWLFKNKFDVFGLIEKGLAIDVNTLEVNPYD